MTPWVLARPAVDPPGSRSLRLRYQPTRSRDSADANVVPVRSGRYRRRSRRKHVQTVRGPVRRATREADDAAERRARRADTPSRRPDRSGGTARVRRRVHCTSVDGAVHRVQRDRRGRQRPPPPTTTTTTDSPETRSTKPHGVWTSFVPSGRYARDKATINHGTSRHVGLNVRRHRL